MRGQRKLERETGEQTGKIDRILDLLQGEDPLERPGEGLVSIVKELHAEKKQRDERATEIKRLAWGGALAGGTALGAVAWEGFKRWLSGHWH